MHKSTALFLVFPLLTMYAIQADDQTQKNMPNSLSNDTKLYIQKNLTLAEKHRSAGDRDQARKYYEKILECDPHHVESLFQIGNSHYHKNEYKQALNYYEKAIESGMPSPQFHYNAGLCLKNLKEYDQAIEHFEKVTKLNPSNTTAFQHLAKLFQDKGDHAKTINYCLKGLENDPDNVMIHRYLGIAYRSIDEFDKAIDHFRIATKLRPKEITFMADLANVLVICNELDEALGIYQKILLINPEATSALYNVAYILRRQGYVHEGMQTLKIVLEKNPDHGQANLSLGLSYLSLGNFEDGWVGYEWRWEHGGRTPRKFPQPLWDGSDINGKTILIWAEQGLGDTFQFIRYAKLIKEMGATIIFQTQGSLADILSLCDYIDYVIPRNKKLPDFDVHIPLLTLPLIFKTVEETIPAEIPYLKATPELTDYWRKQLAEDENFRIGICWQGNANYSTQLLRRTVAAKSMSAALFEPLSKIPGITLYSLQKVHGTDQLKDLSFVIHDFGPDFDESHGRFMDTAGVIKNLHLVITVDTSVSHFAAALGTPTWILLPEPTDWRWMLERTDTPWYPNVRLFRQPHCGDWESVINEVTKELKALVISHSKKPVVQSNNQTIQTEVPSNEQPNIISKPEQHKEQNDLASLALDDFVDKMTLLALSLDEEKESDNPDVKQIHELYNQYLGKWPQLKEKSQQILYANRYLLALKKQLADIDNDVLHPLFIEISRKVSRATKFKKEIMKEIKELTR